MSPAFTRVAPAVAQLMIVPVPTWFASVAPTGADKCTENARVMHGSENGDTTMAASFSTEVVPVNGFTGNVSVPDAARYQVLGAVPAWVAYETDTAVVDGCDSVTGKNIVTCAFAFATIVAEPIETDTFAALAVARGAVGHPKISTTRTVVSTTTRPRKRLP
jgi:hypothetical protein